MDMKTLSLLLFHESLDCIVDVEHLSQFMYKPKPNNKHKPKPENKPKPKQSNQIQMNVPNDLFWCIFTHVYEESGYSSFINYKNREMEEKLKVVEYLSKNQRCLKPMKMTIIKTKEIMGDLLTNMSTNILALYALAAYYHRHVLVIFEKTRTYIDIFPEEEEKCVIVCDLSSQRFYLCRPSTQGGWIYNYNGLDRSITDIENTYLKQISHDKVLQSIGNYKMNDLLVIAEKVGVEPPSTKYKKDELYEMILKRTSIHSTN
jgi:hypothetical protein